MSLPFKATFNLNIIACFVYTVCLISVKNAYYGTLVFDCLPTQHIHVISATFQSRNACDYQMPGWYWIVKVYTCIRIIWRLLTGVFWCSRSSDQSDYLFCLIRLFRVNSSNYTHQTMDRNYRSKRKLLRRPV